MYLLAASILLSTILYLVDKNQAWGKFWRALGAMALLCALGVAGIYADDVYKTHKAKVAAAASNTEWQDFYPAPEAKQEEFDETKYRYVKLPDGTWGKFSRSASRKAIMDAIRKSFPNAPDTLPADFTEWDANQKP